MALIDYNNMFSNAQAVTSSVASTYYIDGRAAGEALNNDIYLIVEVGTEFTGGTSLEIALQTSADSSFSSYTTLYDSGVILLAKLTANTVLVKVPIPIGLLRYLRVYYTVSGTMTAGTVSAFLQNGVYVGV